MATVAFAADFWGELNDHQGPVRRAISKLVETARQLSFQELNQKKGTHLEAYNNGRDRRARTMRVDDNHRLICMDMGDGETLLFYKVDTHDKVDNWMMRNEFRINAATNAIEVVDVVEREELVAQVPKQSATDLFAHRRDKDFLQLGIDEELIGVLRGIPGDDGLLALSYVLPKAQSQAVLMLAGDEAVEQIYKALTSLEQPAEVDTEDFVSALEKPVNQDLFQIITDDEELAKMLAAPSGVWRVYLHHSQRDLAYRPRFSGPVRVTGGAGTGKTVVALHRALALAKPYLDSGERPSTKPILFTTFTRNLARAIERDLRSLGGPELLEVVDVLNVDQLARQIVTDADPDAPGAAGDQDVERLWEELVDEEGLDYRWQFLKSEWEHVVLAQSIGSRSDYFQARRVGRGVPLDRRARAEVWKAVELFTQRLANQNRRSFLQLAEEAAGYLRQRGERPYRHVVIDEAQDLHETQWHLLRAAVEEGENDLFIVGDTHQRIYDRRTSLKREGVNIVGRSWKLRINYRTTAQILKWAMALLGEETYDDMDEGVDEQTLAGYHSLLYGLAPTTCAGGSAKEQADGLVAQIRDWLGDEDLELEDIAVAARADSSLETAAAALTAAGLPSSKLDRELRSGEGIRLGTMHRMKGMEFQCVAVFDCDDERMPNRWAVIDPTADETQHRLDLLQERCLLYVACTRARRHLWVGWSGRPSRFLGPMLGDS